MLFKQKGEGDKWFKRVTITFSVNKKYSHSTFENFVWMLKLVIVSNKELNKE